MLLALNKTGGFFLANYLCKLEPQTMQLKNPHLRRIEWAIFSPSLLSYPFSTEYIRDEAHKEFVLLLLQELDSKPDQIDAHFDQLGNMPMGKYFEQLLFYILDKDDRFDVLLKNYQILQGKQTIGEIDLIVKDTETGVVEHWEIALKYYLQSKFSEDHAVMLGPNAIDNLAKKMKKLTEHQLPLVADLSELGISDTSTIQNKLLLKGQFFYHLSHGVPCNIFPKHINSSHEKGWWCHLSEVEKAIDKSLYWTTIWKPNWIGKLTKSLNHNLLDYSELHQLLKQHFQYEIYSALCIGLKQENGFWIEQTRGFVVNNDWPNGSKK